MDIKIIFQRLLFFVLFVLISCGKPAPDLDPLSLSMDLTVNPVLWATVPAGEFISTLNEHKVVIDYNYEIMVTEVTYAQYAKYLNAALTAKKIKVKEGDVYGHYHGDTFNNGRHEKPINKGSYKYYSLKGQKSRIKLKNGKFFVQNGYDLFPAAYVTWFGAYAYAKFYGWKLPSKLEWEKAARGTDGRSYPFVEEPSPERANYYHSSDPFDAANGTTPVGFYNGRKHGNFQTIDSPGPYGCYDMAGNVAEWISNVVKGTHQRYIYGGSMMEYDYNLRSYTENFSRPHYASFQVGFRCVRQRLR